MPYLNNGLLWKPFKKIGFHTLRIRNSVSDQSHHKWWLLDSAANNTKGSAQTSISPMLVMNN